MKGKHRKTSGLKKRWMLLGGAFALVPAAFILVPAAFIEAPAYSAWHTALSTSESIATATVPTPGSASGVTGSTTTTSSYAATFDGYYCPPISGDTYNGLVYVGGFGEQCWYTWNADGSTYYDTPVYEYSCPSGGSLSGSTCYVTTVTPYIKFTWTTPTAYDASGQPFVTGVDVVEGSSCSTSSWTNVATVSPSADSYTVDNPSTSEYYGLQTTGLGGWTSAVSGCALG